MAKKFLKNRKKVLTSVRLFGIINKLAATNSEQNHPKKRLSALAETDLEN